MLFLIYGRSFSTHILRRKWVEEKAGEGSSYVALAASQPEYAVQSVSQSVSLVDLDAKGP